MTQKLAKLTNSETSNNLCLLKVSIASSVFAVGALIVTPVQAANLIQNGSFEDGLNPGAFKSLSAPSTDITGWKVSQGAIDYIGTFWQASEGVRSLDMNGPSIPGAIEQAFSTTPGTKYQVTFDLAGNYTAVPNTKTLRVSTGPGIFADFTFDATGKGPNNMGWVSKSWEFTATGSSTTLLFSSLTSGGAGPALDNVSVIALSDPPTSVPEPSSMLGLLGLGVLGIGSALKRQS